MKSDSNQRLCQPLEYAIAIAVMAPTNSVSNASSRPSETEKQPCANPRRLQKVPPREDGPY